MLKSSPDPLADIHDLVMLDLDGVVYIGDHAVAGAAEAITLLRHGPAALAFVTNNASRPPELVAERLRGLGIPAAADDVVTSAQAAARLLRSDLAAGSAVVCLGGTGLREALLAEALAPVDVHTEAAAIVSGYGPDVRWREIMTAAVRVRAGLPWVASNTDHTIPTPDGTAPGHGVLVRTIADFSGVEPRVAGKPSPPLLEETIRRHAGERPLMVGDRLDTDIAGGHAVGVDSLLVLTGVTGPAELLEAAPDHRPSYIAADLDGLHRPHPPVERAGARHRVRHWSATVEDDTLRLRCDDDAGSDPVDAWRCAAAAAWAHRDHAGRAPRLDDLRLPPPGVRAG